MGVLRARDSALENFDRANFQWLRPLSATPTAFSFSLVPMAISVHR